MTRSGASAPRAVSVFDAPDADDPRADFFAGVRFAVIVFALFFGFADVVFFVAVIFQV